MSTSQRPTSLTIISWYQMIGGVAAFASSIFTLLNPESLQGFDFMDSSPLLFVLPGMVFSIVSCACGFLIMRGNNLGKKIYLALVPASLILSVITTKGSLWVSSLFGALVFVLIAYFLTRPAAISWLTGKSAPESTAAAAPREEIVAAPDVRQPLTGTQIAGIVFLVISGMPLMGWAMMIYPMAKDPKPLLLMSGVMAIPTLGFLLAGIFMRGARYWKMTLGIVLAATGMMLFLSGAMLWQSRGAMAAQMERQKNGKEVREFQERMLTGNFIIGPALALTGGALIALHLLLRRRRE